MAFYCLHHITKFPSHDTLTIHQVPYPSFQTMFVLFALLSSLYSVQCGLGGLAGISTRLANGVMYTKLINVTDMNHNCFSYFVSCSFEKFLMPRFTCLIFCPAIRRLTLPIIQHCSMLAGFILYVICQHCWGLKTQPPGNMCTYHLSLCHPCSIYLNPSFSSRSGTTTPPRGLLLLVPSSRTVLLIPGGAR